MIVPELDPGVKTVPQNTIILQASWVFPVSGPCIFRGALAIAGGRIVSVGSREQVIRQFDNSEIRDYGEAIIVPGLINLHSHLDYSALRHLNSGAGLFDWIPMLMKNVAKWTPADFLSSATYGAQQAALSGTTFIVDSSYSGFSAEAIAAAGLKGMVGLELFGLDRTIAPEVWHTWQERLDKLTNGCSATLKQALDEGKIRFTCSPHAPYTVSPPLWQAAKSWADAHGLPLLAHLAESKQESDWLKHSDPAIDAFLMKVSPSNKDSDTATVLKVIDWKNSGASPVAHLKRHNLLANNLVAAHCVQVDSDDIKLLKESGVSVAHCPRSNARLRNGRAPLADLRHAGVNVGLGTDSLASTDDLNPLAEAAFALNLSRAVDPDCQLGSADMLEMMTLSAARAIGLADKIGSLETGKQADIAVFKIEARHPQFVEPGDAADLLIRFQAQTEAVYVNGETIVEAGRLRNIQAWN